MENKNLCKECEHRGQKPCFNPCVDCDHRVNKVEYRNNFEQRNSIFKEWNKGVAVVECETHKEERLQGWNGFGDMLYVILKRTPGIIPNIVYEKIEELKEP